MNPSKVYRKIYAVMNGFTSLPIVLPAFGASRRTPMHFLAARSLPPGPLTYESAQNVEYPV